MRRTPPRPSLLGREKQPVVQEEKAEDRTASLHASHNSRASPASLKNGCLASAARQAEGGTLVVKVAPQWCMWSSRAFCGLVHMCRVGPACPAGRTGLAVVVRPGFRPAAGVTARSRPGDRFDPIIRLTNKNNNNIILIILILSKETAMTQASTAIPADVRERIIAAAADLFEQSGRETMPTVDAVRRAARVDMNAASSVMKEWRRAQTAQAAPVAVAVPESVQQASSAAVATIWQQAQELANESLRSAQAAWETERGELDAMRQELAEAFERQAAELEAAGATVEAQITVAAQQAQELAAVRQKLADASSRADKAEARIDEIEHRAADLRAELDRAHADADRLRTENTAAHAATEAARAELVKAQAKAEAIEQAHAEQHKQTAAEVEAARAATEATRAELVKVQAKAEAVEQAQAEQRKQAAAEAHRAAERMTKAQAERDDATKAAAEARERAAGLAGQVQAMQEQNAALVAAIKPQGEPKPKKTPPAKA